MEGAKGRGRQALVRCFSFLLIKLELSTFESMGGRGEAWNSNETLNKIYMLAYITLVEDASDASARALISELLSFARGSALCNLLPSAVRRWKSLDTAQPPEFKRIRIYQLYKIK